ncbi:MAG: inorganic phosphate transporter [Clostridia bacterium]|nr:MAG: inorganic phosphate transporter [Clostridia bacterium]
MNSYIVFGLLFFLALLYNFLNGFHDAANVVATIIASRAMTARAALAMAALANFIGPLVLGVAVATTIGKDFVSSDSVTITLLIAALTSANLWNIVTWWMGIPSSSSHALAGGLVGAALMYGGVAIIKMDGLIKISLALFISPVLGFVLGWILLKLTYWMAAGATPKVNKTFNKAQWLTAAALALSHGANDAQKAMGIIVMGLVTLGFQDHFYVPTWVIVVSAIPIGLGTASGGWRIIHTLGGKFFRIRPIHSFTSQLASALVILGASVLGGPVSTTHVVSSTIVGVGAAERKSQVRWLNLTDIAVAWLITVPITAALAAILYPLLRILLGP